MVLGMMAVMETIEELTQLESLSVRQKQQVWMVTPEDVKLRLKAIRAAAHKAAQEPEKLDELEKDELEELDKPEDVLEEVLLETVDEPEEPNDLEELDELDQLDELAILAEHKTYGTLYSEPSQLIKIGDRVVLKAEPHLNAAEMIAIWEVVAVQDKQARIEAKGLGNRLYPIAGMVIYPTL